MDVISVWCGSRHESGLFDFLKLVWMEEGEERNRAFGARQTFLSLNTEPSRLADSNPKQNAL